MKHNQTVRHHYFANLKRLLTCLYIIPLLALMGPMPHVYAEPAVPKFIQLAYAVPQTSQKTVTAKYDQAQTAGNTNIVAIGWRNTTATLTSVTDSIGNVYSPATNTFSGNGMRQTIYYAKNIAAAPAKTNTVTVKFNVSAKLVDLRITEYSGLDPTNPLDKTASATGTSTVATTPSVMTTSSNELIFAAGISTTRFTSAGTGFTSRVITNPNAGIVFDKNVNSIGAYPASANQVGKWVLQVVSFRAANIDVVDTTPPSVPSALNAAAFSPTQINLSWNASNDNVSVVGYKIYRNSAQVATSAGTSYQDTGLTQNTTYTYAVVAYDASGNTSALSANAFATTPAQNPTGSSMFENFNLPDGDLSNGWLVPVGQPIIKIVSGKGSTLNSTQTHYAYKTHGLNVSGDWQLEFDVSAPLTIGSGGAVVGLVNPADGSGYSVFTGNAVHIQRYNPGGTHYNMTNNGRTGEGAGQLANHVVFTHTAAGNMEVYLDGVLWSHVNDTQRTAGSLLFVSMQNIDSPLFETTIDNLVLQDYISVN